MSRPIKQHSVDSLNRVIATAGGDSQKLKRARVALALVSDGVLDSTPYCVAAEVIMFKGVGKDLLALQFLSEKYVGGELILSNAQGVCSVSLGSPMERERQDEPFRRVLVEAKDIRGRSPHATLRSYVGATAWIEIKELRSNTVGVRGL
jgi:hypothetical protein